MMAVVAKVFEAAGLTVSEETETMFLRTRDQTPTVPSPVIGAAGQRYRHTTQFLYLGGIIHKNAGLWLKIEQRTRLMWACFKRFRPELYDRETAPISLKIRMLKAEVIETLSYGCVTWTIGAELFAKLRTVHHQILLWVIGFQRRQRADYTLSYAEVLRNTQCVASKRPFVNGGSCLRGP